MPLPKVRKNEQRAKFLGRCMKNAVMRSEFTNIKQRIAVCYSQFRRKGKRTKNKK